MVSAAARQSILVGGGGAPLIGFFKLKRFPGKSSFYLPNFLMTFLCVVGG